ncbi:MAG: pilus assembly protein [Quinella sp. 1Q7]|nr:pilus assembly protein [Quinella sp. 1Q7]
MKFKRIKQHGQVMILYALLIPLMFLFVGVGLDLGWYYLNVSRLQNAADAAALAGAQTLVKTEDFNNYLVISLAPNKVLEDFDDYKDAFSNIGTNGDLRNYHKIEDIADTLKEGRAVVEQYTRENLEDSTTVNTASNTTDTVSAIDGWNNSTAEADKKVTGKIELKYKIVDGKNDVYGPMYYVVNLDEKIRHFFMPGWFDPMDAPVRAVVLLKPHYKGLIEPMQQLERTMVIDNWEYTNKFKETTTGLSVSGGKWNHYMAGTTADNTGIDYKDNNPYRTENITVSTARMSRDGGQPTEANGGQFYSENEVDSLTSTFKQKLITPSNRTGISVKR